jgi:type II secretory pathway component HofQ
MLSPLAPMPAPPAQASPQYRIKLKISELGPDGKQKILAEPVIVTTEETEARFFSGEEVPIVVKQEAGKNVEVLKLGLSTVVSVKRLKNERIHLRLNISQKNLVLEKGILKLEAREIDTALQGKFGETLKISVGGVEQKSKLYIEVTVTKR